jgi:hypothetical protein
MSSNDDTYHYYFYLQGETLTDELTKRVYEAGFDDALLGSRDGLVFLSFSADIPTPKLHDDPKMVYNPEKIMEDWREYHKKTNDLRLETWKRIYEAGFYPVHAGDPNNNNPQPDYNYGVNFRKGENTTLERLAVKGSIKGYYILERFYEASNDCGDKYEEVESLVTIGLPDGTQLYFVDGCDSVGIYDNEAECRYNYPWLFPTP